MKQASAGLISFLNGLGPTAQPLIADLLTIVQQDGTITRLTSAALNVQSKSLAISFSDSTVYTFLAGGVTFSRTRVSTKVGLEVGDMRLTLAIPPTATLEGVPWPQAVDQGALDAAVITLERAFMATWGVTTAGTEIIFKGYTGEAKVSRSTIDLQVRAGIAILANQMPRRLWQPACLHVLYDAGCALVKASFTVTGAVAAGSTVSVVHTGLTQADHYFELGVITFTSGVNVGLSRRVYQSLNASGAVSVVPPLPAAPATSDTFSIYPGCDKTQQTCVNKFANLAHFAGVPYVPVAEAAV